MRVPASVSWQRLLAGNVVVGLGYYGLATLGSVAQFTGQVQVAWLPVGFAAAMLYLGDLRWFAGGMLADLLLGTGVYPFHYQLLASPVVSFETIGNTIEFALAAYLMRRWLGRDTTLERPREVTAMLLALVAGVAVSTACGTASVWWGGLAPPSGLWPVAYTWWLGDLSGGLLVVPVLLVWGAGPLTWRVPPAFPVTVTAQWVGVLALVTGLSVLAFSFRYPLPYIVFPALVLAAVNVGLRGATVALMCALGVAIGMTAARSEPFAEQSINAEVLATQLYILVATLTTLTLGAAVSARHRAAAELAEARHRSAQRAEAERQRIARDLHDSVSQTLFSLGLHAGIARHEAARAVLPEDSALPEAIAEVAGLAQAALLEMRASIFDLRGGAVAEQGLVTALAAHGAALAVRHDVRVAVTGPEDKLPLAPAVEETLFRIGQEAITNAVKHSGSPSVSAEVQLADACVVLTVRDQGAGFDPDASYAGHLGLDLMRARAAEAGGNALINSAPGAGTTIRVTVPSHGSGLPRLPRVKSLPDRQQGCLRPRRQSEFAQDVADVRARRPLADHQPPGDLLVGPPFGDQPQDLQFTLREVGKRIGRCVLLGKQRSHQPARDRRVEMHLAVMRGTDRDREFLGRRVLDQISGGSGLQCGLDP